MKPQENKNQDIVVEDEMFGTTAELNIKSIALEQFRRCCQAGSKRGTEPGTDSFPKATRMLARVLQPNILKDKEIRQEVEEIVKQIDTIRKKFKAEYETMKEENQGNDKQVDWEMTISELKGRQDNELDELYEDFFGILSTMLNKLNYFGDTIGNA